MLLVQEKLQKKNKKRLPRKLKKAVRQCVGYYRACSLKEDILDSEKWFVEHYVFSYKKLRQECAEKFFITKEEFDSKELSARKLFLKYLEESPEKLIKMKEDETEI